MGIMIWDDIHYNTNETRTHNCDVNYLLSGREAGKSTAVLRMIIEHYIKHKEGAIWLLRQKSQLNKQFFETFLNDFEDFPVIMFRKVVYMQDREDPTKPDLDREVISFFGLATANKDIKQTKPKDKRFMVYDEFLIDHTLPHERYLPREAEVLFKVWETVLRRSNRRTQLWLLGNPYSLINPYFAYMKINPKEVEKRINKFYKPYPKVLVYYFEVHPDLLKEKDDTTYGFLSKLNPDYYDHTFKSKVRYKSMFPVRKFTFYNNKTYLFAIKIEGKVLEFWDIGSGGIYVAENRYKKDTPIAVDFDSFNNDSTLLTTKHHMYDIIRNTRHIVANRTDVVVESSNIEDLLKLFAKMG